MASDPDELPIFLVQPRKGWPTDTYQSHVVGESWQATTKIETVKLKGLVVQTVKPHIERGTDKWIDFICKVKHHLTLDST